MLFKTQSDMMFKTIGRSPGGTVSKGTWSIPEQNVTQEEYESLVKANDEWRQEAIEKQKTDKNAFVPNFKIEIVKGQTLSDLGYVKYATVGDTSFWRKNE